MNPKLTKWMAWLAGTGVAAAALFLWVSLPRPDKADSSADVVQEMVPAADRPTTNDVQPQSPIRNSDIPLPFTRIEQPEPSPVWTDEDGRSTNAIRQLAHNELEVQRMLEENDTIYRRQLVHRMETVPELIQRGRDTGLPLKSLILPVLDGQEVEVEVMDIRTSTDGRSGSVNGRVKGHFNSLVSVGFSNGCESYNIISPDDGLFIAADAYEPGQVVVKEIDPNTYGVHPETETPCVVSIDELKEKYNQEP